MTQDELLALLGRQEGQFLEFKSLWDLKGDAPKAIPRRTVRDWIAKYAAAFANADGGTVILGADDDGRPSGHGYPEEAIQEFLRVPEARLRPAVSVRTQRLDVGESEVIVIEVPMAPQAVMVEGDGFPFRVSEEVIFEAQEAINDRKQSYRNVGWERRIRPEASLGDIDLGLARSFLSRTAFGNRPLEDLLVHYGLAMPKAGGMAITNAALLLFGRPPLARWHPRAGIRFFRVHGTERRHGSSRNVTQVPRIDLPLAQAIEAAHTTASAHIRRSEKLHDLFFREMPEYPEFAWQEAIVNAFAHRDYAEQTREIEVWLFDDRLEVESPGGPPAPVTLDKLRQRIRVHASRNPLIVRALADVGIMREEGEGIPRIFEEMEKSYLRPPKFDADDTRFQIVLENEPIFKGASAGWQKLVTDLPVSTNQKRVLMGHADGFTNEDFRRLCTVDRDHAYREIQDLVDKGIVLPARSRGRGAVYRLSPGLRQQTAWLDARIRGLSSFLAAHGAITNRQYRELFHLKRDTAYRELRSLAQDGFLRMVGKQRGARYVPGPGLAGQ